MNQSLGITLVGLLTLAAGAVLVWRGWRPTRWPTVEGRIEESDIVGIGVHEYSGWRLDLRYTYAVNGKEYQGGTVRLDGGPTFGGELEAGEACGLDYRPGSTVDVYYNPADPSDALLEPGASGGAWGIVLFGLLMVIMGVIPGP